MHLFNFLHFTTLLFSHTRTAVPDCCNGDEASQRKTPNSTHCHPLNNLHKNWHLWLCHGYHPTSKILLRSIYGFLFPRIRDVISVYVDAAKVISFWLLLCLVMWWRPRCHYAVHTILNYYMRVSKVHVANCNYGIKYYNSGVVRHFQTILGTN